MPRLRVYVSPALELGAPEVNWLLRTLLGGLGRPWEQVGADAEACDLAYAPAGEETPSARVRLNGDVLAKCFALLTGADEQDWEVNKHGHRTPPGTLAEREALCLEAPVSRAFGKLDAALVAAGLGPAPHPRWPDGKTWAAAASHDVDYPLVLRWLEPLRIVARRGRAGRTPALDVLRGRRHHWHFDSWIELEERFGIRSAFYFVPRRGSLAQYALGTPDPFYDVGDARFAEAFKRIEAAGSEVGMQASYRAAEDVGRFGSEKEALETAVGHRVEGNRHHYWHMDHERPERTLHIHEQVGLGYDCSLALDDHLGWRRGHAWPFRPWSTELRREVGTLQLSTAWMDDQVFATAAANGIESPGDRIAALERLIDSAADAGGLLVADMHEYVFDPELFPGWAETYAGFWERVVARSDVWTATPAEMARHWTRRTEQIETASTGLGV